ncbi:MAG: hypothetical protein BWX95_00478 [Bacteroidetes bacterium ADurb.Bin141]|nr:MAG: hypothetical protein UZ10_BCD003001681 [Bacteroidetes bacterium OLB10]MBX3105963.1 hemerythrin domain-containing protein [Bacteroidota bacterium]MCB8930622.1 hemerythrin domain-containing protein [Bacteroidia bacterium]MCE7954532.1 hemerythrin domain-containing protein [Bacteroidetes bacterium CHB6]OQB64656.1 MAG: hypothetical protein BWX95_00478 [Bacteroidetes bacterium ADurb.Bin141]
MNKPLYDFFTNDHHRVEGFLDKATEKPGEINMEYYHQFRTGLLKHIKMEENILFPAAQKANNGVQLPLQAKLRLDHGAITMLLVVRPTADVIKVLRHVLELHDKLEEEPGGMYDVCEQLTSGETDMLLEKLRNATEVPVLPYNDADFAMQTVFRSLERAGFNYDEIVKS